MLTELHIKNIAVIEKADITFRQGLNILTGETGAGKSIIIDALNAVLGGRASRESVRSGTDEAVVTAVFDADGTYEWCRENDVDIEDGVLILRRRITSDGKSAGRVNGVPLSAAQLRALGVLLIDIHGQNDGRQLLDEGRHLAYLDRFGDLRACVDEYTAIYDRYQSIKNELCSLDMDEEEKARLIESLSFRIEELESAKLKPGESEELAARRELMKNTGRLTEAANGAYAALYETEGSALERVGDAEQTIDRAAALAPELAETAKIITDAKYALEDAAERLREFSEKLDFLPDEYDRVESRLALISRLSKKYGGDENEMLSSLEEYKQRLDGISFAGERAQKLRAELSEAEVACVSQGAKLTGARRDASMELQRRIEEELHDLNMPSVLFEVEFKVMSGSPGFDKTGADEVRFLMSANVGEPPAAISKIASGGEMSRIMLAIKSVFAEKDAVPTLVFDEIDSGVSGVAAQRVGEKLARLSRHKQVLCITHLPQIAAMADTQFEISKSESDGRTYTDVRELDSQGRKQEIARLYGGDNITETTLISAGEQLAAAERFKSGVESY